MSLQPIYLPKGTRIYRSKPGPWGVHYPTWELTFAITPTVIAVFTPEHWDGLAKVYNGVVENKIAILLSRADATLLNMPYRIVWIEKEVYDDVIKQTASSR